MHPRNAIPLALAALLLAVAAAACGPTTTPGTPSDAPSGTTTPPAPTEVPGGGRTPASSPGTFETAWGTAWDALPAGFPVPPGAEPATPGDPAEGPVSGAFVVDRPPDEVVALVRDGLGAAGYSTEALGGPYEDGGFVVDLRGEDPACRVQARVRPLGGTTMLSVLYGAACPWG